MIMKPTFGCRICPRCGDVLPEHPALSRVPLEGEQHEYVCSSCGVEEAVEAWEGRLFDWRPVRHDEWL